MRASRQRNQAGTFRTACCLLGETKKTCKGTPAKQFNDGKEVPGGPIAWQTHDPDHHILWKDIFLEENPGEEALITTN